jgi:glycosyltransferase involved in cell wall biosynthesis
MGEPARGRAVLAVPVMPAVAGNGLAMRAGLLLEGLARRFDVDVLVVPVFGRPPEQLDANTARGARQIQVLSETDAPTDPVAWLRGQLATVSGRRRAEALHPLPVLCAKVTAAAASELARLANGAAVVVVMRSYLAPLLDELLDLGTRPPIVLDVDDVESETQRTLGHDEQAVRFKRLESYYLPLVDLVLTCSADDAALLAGRHRAARCEVLPNAVRPPSDAEPAAARHDLMLVGTLSYEPNAEAARWLAGEVLPLLGGVSVAIVGRRPPPDVLALARAGRVTVAADVEDVSVWYAAAGVAVIPVLRGGGSRIKLIEAFAHGLPVVSTSAGARGLPWPGAPAPVQLADTAEQFAARCRVLLDDPGQARALGRQGRSLVRDHASVAVVATRLAELVTQLRPRPAVRITSTPPLLSVALIVRDEQAVLGECLKSLHGLADEIIVVDTGSADASIEIARAHGAEVLELPWCADFSAARNFGLDRVRGEWVLYIDADERVRPVSRERLETRLADAGVLGLRVLLHPVVGSTPYYEYRLWRNDPRIRFRGVMHERVVDAIHRAAAQDGRSVEDWPELVLDHVGYEGDQRHKHVRDLPLLETQLQREPDNVYNWRHLYRVLSGLGRGADAERALERAVSLARAQIPPSVDGSLAWADLVRLRHQRGDDVTELLAEARSRWPEQWLIRFIEGLVALEAGQLVAAEECFRALLAADPGTLPASGLAYDERIFGSYAQSSLGLTLFRAGRFEESAAAYAEAEALEPGESGYRVKRMLSEARAARSS